MTRLALSDDVNLREYLVSCVEASGQIARSRRRYKTVSVADERALTVELIVSGLEYDGYSVVRNGSVPPWMEETGNTYCDCTDVPMGPCSELNCNCNNGDVLHYRLKKES